MPRRARLIAQGAYGCAFSPALPCEAGTARGRVSGPGTVGKVFKLSKGDAEDEARQAERVARFDPGNRVTPALLGRCRVSAAAIAAAEGGACRGTFGLPVGFPAADGAEQVVFASAGDASVEALLRAPLAWADREALVGTFVDVLRAVEAMRAKGLVHLDLHAGNVVVDRRRRGRWRAKVIDFGWLRPAADAVFSFPGLRSLLVQRPLTPFNDVGALARRARLSAAAAAAPAPPGGGEGPVLEASAALDAYAVGVVLWRVLAHAPRGSQPPPEGRRASR